MATGLTTKNIDLTAPAPAGVSLPEVLNDTTSGRFFDADGAEAQNDNFIRHAIGIEVDYDHLLRNKRGLLMQFGLSEEGEFINLRDPVHPEQAEVVSLKFDAGNAGTQGHAWELSIAKANIGQTIYRLIGTKAQKLRGNAQGLIPTAVEASAWEAVGIASMITTIISSEQFREYAAEVNDTKTKAQDDIGRYALELVDKDFAPRKIKSLLEKKEKGNKSTGFPAIPPITWFTQTERPVSEDFHKNIIEKPADKPLGESGVEEAEHLEDVAVAFTREQRELFAEALEGKEKLLSIITCFALEDSMMYRRHIAELQLKYHLSVGKFRGNMTKLLWDRDNPILPSGSFVLGDHRYAKTETGFYVKSTDKSGKEGYLSIVSFGSFKEPIGTIANLAELADDIEKTLTPPTEPIQLQMRLGRA